MYLTSSRDESRRQGAAPDAQHAQGARRSRSASTAATSATPTAAARSLSDPAVHRGGPGALRVAAGAAPGEVGIAATIAALRAAVAAAGGPATCSASSTSSCRSAPAGSCPRDFWPALAALRKELDLPLIAVETATATYRSRPRRVRVDRRSASCPTCSRGGAAARPATCTASARWLVADAAHAGLDLGRRRAVAGPRAPPAARGAPARRRARRSARSTRRWRGAHGRAVARPRRSTGCIDAGDRAGALPTSCAERGIRCAGSRAAGSAWCRRSTRRARRPRALGARCEEVLVMRVARATRPARRRASGAGSTARAFRGEIKALAAIRVVPVHAGRRRSPTRERCSRRRGAPAGARALRRRPVRGAARHRRGRRRRRPRTSWSPTTTPTCATSIRIPRLAAGADARRAGRRDGGGRRRAAATAAA